MSLWFNAEPTRILLKFLWFPSLVTSEQTWLLWLTTEPTRILLKFLWFFQGGLQSLLESIKDKDPDKVSIGLASALDNVAELELLQVTEAYG